MLDQQEMAEFVHLYDKGINSTSHSRNNVGGLCRYADQNLSVAQRVKMFMAVLNETVDDPDPRNRVSLMAYLQTGEHTDGFEHLARMTALWGWDDDLKRCRVNGK